MEPEKKYYTMGQFVHDHRPSMIDMPVEQADIIRSEAIQIAGDKHVNVRFKKRYKSGPRNGKSAIQLPLWVWAEAFDKHQKPKP
jgi:hypothetical protein